MAIRLEGWFRRGATPVLGLALLLASACASTGDDSTSDGGDADHAGDAHGDLGPGDGDVEPDGSDGDAVPDGEPEAMDGDAGGDGEPDGGDGDGDAADGDDGGGPPRECVTERCGDGLDNDCDGAVDEECYCLPGDSAECFRGDPRHRSVGRCRDGVMLCEGSSEFGFWGACAGDLLEEPETCDPAAVDEDCNGAGNDGCDCVPGDPDIACGTDEGECHAGFQRCVDGSWTGCDESRGPGPEECNDADDDCDGYTDEAIRRVCGSDVGACRSGYESCDAGVWGACAGGHEASDEVCDALDNDCDGDTDEEVTRACGITLGRCIAGLETCTGGSFGDCEGAVDPIGEICNGVDDDCDGDADEELVRPCGTDTGECVAGLETCLGSSGWSACAGVVWPGTETCDGTRDEDCDGTTDEGCTCTTGATRPCGSDIGECVAGSQVCSAGGAWGACGGAVAPATEQCNLLDDDCDGATDEGCDCVTGVTRACGSDVGECSPGLETCDGSGHWGPCAGAVTPGTEACNGLDDDCDGGTDEGGVCPRFPPTVTCPGSRSTVVGTAVPLAGSGSDPDGGPVTYLWDVVSRPTGSTAGPTPAAAATTSFTPDVDGTYTLRLCVTDDELESACCTTTVAATPSCTPPTAPTLTTCPTSWDRRPIVEFNALPAGITYQLFKDADSVPYATVSADGQNYFRPAVPLAAGGPPPGVTLSLVLRACRDADPTCCASSPAVTVLLVEACTTPVAPTSANLVFSEYVIDGDGVSPHLEAGEAIEITNLSHCPVALNGHHFSYCNGTCSAASYRWMDFGASEVVPPRGVYVAIRDRAFSSCAYGYFGADDPGLFGLKLSTLEMQGDNLASGWFVNSGGSLSMLRIASGAWPGNLTGGSTIEQVAPYLTSAGSCRSIGFNAVDACGNIAGTATPTEVLNPNQLGRLWHPCDAVVAPNPAACR